MFLILICNQCRIVLTFNFIPISDPEHPSQPPMMTFKQFLNKQDDTITQDDAIKLFEEYKLDFKKQQINEFFLQHKEEEWWELTLVIFYKVYAA